LSRERNSSLRPTALVHEAYLRLAALHEIRLQDRPHFLSMAARVSRQALLDEARRRRAAKRDGGDPVTFSDTNLGEPNQAHDAIDVDKLLTELEQYDALAAVIVALRVAKLRLAGVDANSWRTQLTDVKIGICFVALKR
jgi:hypothetical protein